MKLVTGGIMSPYEYVPTSSACFFNMKGSMLDRGHFQFNQVDEHGHNQEV